MTLLKILQTNEGQMLPLPHDLSTRLGLQVGQDVAVELDEESGLIILFPVRLLSGYRRFATAPALLGRRKERPRRPRYDEVYAQNREPVSQNVPFPSATISREAVQALQGIPSYA